MRSRPLALLALLLIALAYATPSAAFEEALYARDASAAIVSSSNGYDAVSVVGSCDVPDATGGTCDAVTVTNKGTSAQLYTVSEDPASAEVLRYRIAGSAWASADRITTPAAVAVGDGAVVTLDIADCLACGTRQAYYTIEGEKADSLNSMQTKIKVTINFT